MAELTGSILTQLFTFGARRPGLAIALVLAMTVATSFGLPLLKIDTSYDSLINPLDPENGRYEEIIGAFRSDYIVLIYLQADDLFSTPRLRQIEDLTHALERIEGAEDVQGLFTISNIRNDDGWLDVSPVLETTPESPAELADALTRARNNPFVMGNILNDAATATAINVVLEPRWRDDDFAISTHDRIESLLAPLRDTFDAAFQLGPPRTMVTGKRAVQSDMKIIGVVAVLLLLSTLFLFLRTRVAILLPVVTAGFSLYWTLGLLGLAGVPLAIMTAALPALIVVVGSTEDTHMLSAYLTGLKNSSGDRHIAVRYMARKVGQATLLTALTTTLGFAFGGLTLIELMRNSAIALALGMAVNLVATILILPTLLAYAGPRESARTIPWLSPRRLVDGIANVAVELSTKWRRGLIIVALPATLGCIAVAGALQPANDPVSLLNAEHPLLRDIDTLSDHLAGLQLFYVVLDSPAEHSFVEPEYMNRVAAVQAAIERNGSFDLTLSLADHLSFVNREMNEGRPDMFRVPNDANLIEQYLLLFSRRDLRSFATPDFGRANILVRHNIFNSARLNVEIESLTREIAEAAGPGITVQIISKGILLSRAAETLIYSLMLSFGILVSVVAGIIALAYRSIRLGLISLVPNVLPASAVFVVMAVFGIPLSTGTALAAIVVLGIAVDDTIHLINAFRQFDDDFGDREVAASAAIRMQAMPVSATTFALTACFASLTLSDFSAVGDFGFLCSIAIAFALPCDLVLMPALLRTFVKRADVETSGKLD